MTITTPPRLAIAASPAPRPGPDPRLAAVVSAATAPVRASAGPADPPLSQDPTRRLAPPFAPAEVSAVLGWTAAACEEAGQPVNVTVSAATHDVHIHVDSAELLWAWMEYMYIPPASLRVSRLQLGPMAEATTTRNGWALHVRLFGQAAEELR